MKGLMAAASQIMVGSDPQKCLLRRLSQNSSLTSGNAKVEIEDFCRSHSGLVELERQLYTLANEKTTSHCVLQKCVSLVKNCNSTSELFKVFCSCSWADRYKDPVICKLFYDLVNFQQEESSTFLFLNELETACEELLRVLTHLGTPTTLQFAVVSLLYNLFRLKGLPSLHKEAIESYLEEIARALWPYCMPSAPNLWGSEVFCDAQCDVLKACGKLLESKCPVNTERTFQVIDSKLISGNISQYSRFRLLEIKELRAGRWEFSEATRNSYKSSYLKYLCPSRKDLLIQGKGPAPKNDIIRTNSDPTEKKKPGSEPVTVVRISESELWHSCQSINDMQLGKEKSSVSCISGGLMGRSESFRTRCSIQQASSYSDMQPSSIVSSDTAVEVSELQHQFTDVLSDPLVDGARRSASPCSTGSSEGGEVFTDTDEVFTVGIKNQHFPKAVPALHRPGLNKLRRPFKSDSAVPSDFQNPAKEAALHHSQGEELHIESSLTSTRYSSVEECSQSSIRQSSGYKFTKENAAIEQLHDIACDSLNESITLGNNKEHGDMHVGVNVRLEKCIEKKATVSAVTGSECTSSTKLSVASQNDLEGLKTENWRDEKSTDIANGNWTERKLSDSMELANMGTSRSLEDENWREKNSGSSREVWSSCSSQENWRFRRSQSKDESIRDSLFSDDSQKSNASGFSVTRQDSEEKGRRISRGGFGPRPDSPVSCSEETHKQEILEIALSEEESQGIRWRKLAEIQSDCSCRIFHDRERCIIEIRGDQQFCKVAKKRVYSFIASLDEEFGALVPLSEEILEHLEAEGRSILAEQIAAVSRANVKLISDTQLFISGYRNCVYEAKQLLAKMKVMLKYTDDPDVVIVEQQENSEGQLQLVNKLFAALNERPQATQPELNSNTSADATSEGAGLSREFILSCATSPIANQCPADLSLERNEDWVNLIVLVNGRKGAQEAMGPSRGFGFGRGFSRTNSSSE